MRFRLRILRHKWENYYHGYWVFMLQSRFPFVSLQKAPFEYDHVAEILCAINKSSLDIIIEKYEKNGTCGKKLIGWSYNAK